MFLCAWEITNINSLKLSFIIYKVGIIEAPHPTSWNCAENVMK